MDKEFKKLIQALKLDEKVFTEEVVDKMAVIMESKLSEERDTLKEELVKENEAELKEYKEFLETQLDNYLNEFVSEFTEKNKEQINESVQVKTAQKVLSAFNDMVNSFNIQLDEGTLDESFEVDTLKEQLNEAVNAKIDLENKLQDIQIKDLIKESSEKIGTDSEKAKFVELAEGLAFDDEKSFKEKLTTLKETIKVSANDEEDDTLLEKEVLDQQDEKLEEAANPTKDFQDEYLDLLQD